MIHSDECASLDSVTQFLWNPQTVEGIFDAILALGSATNLHLQATQAVVALRERLFRASDFVTPYAREPSVCVLVSADPLVVAGHWVPQLVERAGARFPLNPTHPLEEAGAGAGAQQAHRIAGSPLEKSPDDMLKSDPEALILCFADQDLASIRQSADRLLKLPWFRELSAIKNNRCVLVDGMQMLTHPGPGIVDAYEWLVGWLNDRPELVPVAFPWQPLHQVRAT